MEGLQRRDLLSGPVQREHEQFVRSLAVRVVRDEPGQFGYEIVPPAEVEFEPDAAFERGEPPFLQVTRRDLEEGRAKTVQAGPAAQSSSTARTGSATFSASASVRRNRLMSTRST